MTTEVDYGYGDAAPDVASQNDTKHDGRRYASDVKDYGYGDAVPDSDSRSTTVNDYGYGDAAPDISNSSSTRNVRVPRRSSLKMKGAPRRASIGCTGEMTINLPGQKRPVKRRTSITFNEETGVKEVEPVASLTDEPEKLWFQQDEYNMIHDKASFMARLAKQGGIDMLADNELCARGLESHIDSDRVQEEQYLAWKSVFLEQCIQRHFGTFDAESVSTLYRLASVESQDRARQRASQDEANIEKYTRSTRQMMRRCSM